MGYTPFHLAFPVSNLESVREFYVSILQCSIGRESDRWIDINFFGHQITAHLEEATSTACSFNSVDGHLVPARHFGAILPWDEWDVLVERMNSENVQFYIDPYTRFKNQPGEQRTFFIQDPSHNFLEFKCFKNKNFVFEV